MLIRREATFFSLTVQKTCQIVMRVRKMIADDEKRPHRWTNITKKLVKCSQKLLARNFSLVYSSSILVVGALI